MADEGQVIRGIDWRATFPVTHIFRAFRIAIHPSKLALGLALLLTVYFGGKILDKLWWNPYRAVPGEIAEYEHIRSGDDLVKLSDWRDETRKSLDEVYAHKLIEHKIITPAQNESPDDAFARAQKESINRSHLGELKTAIITDRDDGIKKIKDQYADAIRAANNQYKADHNDKALKDAKDSALQIQNTFILETYNSAEGEWTEVKATVGQGLFDCFFNYEIRQVWGVVEDVLHNDWLPPVGVSGHLYNFFAIGPIWLIFNHTLFFILFAALFLVAWALFGGAISRIAAVHIARDEKISVRQAMNFAVGKILSFASAPVIPLAIVIVIGMFVSVVSLIGNIPFGIGAMIVGALFIFALLAGFVMTLVLLGTAGGFNLMYPTIAVEGSDSFDAISRSFSYVYARPWRMLWYTTVAVAYGAATYFFVHLFIWLTLVLSHEFVERGIFVSAQNTRPLFSVMWPNPTTVGRLSYSGDYMALSPTQSIGAFFINCWVMLLVSFLGAFAISLYFSANTIIYFLMRTEVDATEMDDVYLEQSEEELEPALNAAPAGVSATEVAVTSVTIDPTPGSDGSSAST